MNAIVRHVWPHAAARHQYIFHFFVLLHRADRFGHIGRSSFPFSLYPAFSPSLPRVLTAHRAGTGLCCLQNHVTVAFLHFQMIFLPFCVGLFLLAVLALHKLAPFQSNDKLLLLNVVLVSFSLRRSARLPVRPCDGISHTTFYAL